MSRFTPFVKARQRMLVCAFAGLSPALDLLAAQGQSLAITATSPTANAPAVSVTAPVSATFNQPLNSGSAAALKVFSAQRGGLRTRGGTPAVVSGNTLTYSNRTFSPFMPGETLFATITTAATSSTGALPQAKVLQFTTGVGGTGRGVFGGGANIPVGDAPLSVATGDVDGDGDLDLAAADNRSGVISIRLNNGAGDFSPGQELLVGKSYCVVMGDVDGDGDLDLLIVDGVLNTACIRLNNGSGTFGGSQAVAVGNFPLSLATGDIDGDGDLDLVTANNGGATSSVRFNDGSGNYTGSQDVAVGATPNSVALGDLDGDGDLDLLTSGFTFGMTSIRLNNGYGVFSGSQEVAVGALCSSLTLGDVDGDGDLDLLAASSIFNTVSVNRNDGRANFVAGQNVPVALGPRSIGLGDVDGDGDLDLLAVSMAQWSTVSIRFNNGSGAFGGNQEVPVGRIAFNLAMGDLDGDGDLDFLAANSASGTVSVRLNIAVPTLTSFAPANGVAGVRVVIQGTHFTGATAVAFRGTAASAFTVDSDTQISATVPPGAATGTLRVTTRDGAISSATNFTVGTPLLVTTRSPTSNAQNVARGTGIGLSFSAPVDGTTASNVRILGQQFLGRRTAASSSSGNGLVLAPNGGDFRPGEKVYVTVPATVRSADGAPTVPYVYQFTAAATGGMGRFNGGYNPAVSGYVTSVAVGDMDGDGDVDLLAATGNDLVSVRLNNGAGVYTGNQDVRVGASPVSLVTGDVDGDGDLDLLTANSGGSTVSVRVNNGTGSFSGQQEVVVGSNPLSLAVGDMDGDGDLDLLTASSKNDNISIRLNDGTGTFGGSQDVSVFFIPYQASIVVGDVDGDGDLDLLTMVQSSGATGGCTGGVLLNDGIGNFTAGPSVVLGSNPGSLILTDVDGDRDLDLLASNSNTVSVRFNDGSGLFSGNQEVTMGDQPNGVIVGDIDGDGDLDLLAANRNATTVSVRLNAGNGVFSGNQEVMVGAGPSCVALTDVDGDGDLDLLANAGTNQVQVRLNVLPPAITGFTPASGPVGTLVTITGTDFTGTTAVSFQGTTASAFAPNSSTQITATVPAGATTGVVRVITPGGVAISAAAFTVVPFTVTARNPTANARNANRNTTVELNFSAALNAGTVNNVKIFSQQYGGLRSVLARTSANATTLTPTVNSNAAGFKPGETVYVTVPATVQSTNGAANFPSVYQFTAAADGGSGNFAGGSNPGVGSDPRSVSMGDVDGDGDLDLLTPDYANSRVNVRLNNGSAVFTNGQDALVGTNPTNVILGDVDGDGDLDMAAASSNSRTISIRLNNGSGVFAGGQDLPIGSICGKIATGDVDGDGDLDIVVAYNNANGFGTIAVRLNDGTGSFTGNQNVPVGSNPTGVVLADVDADGDLDLMVSNNNAVGTVSIRLNNGVGGFSGNTSIAVGNNPLSLAAGDLDGDGDLDLLTGNGGSNSASIRLNNGSGAFSGGSSVTVGDTPFDVAIGDVDGDGDLDLATANLIGNTASVRFNDGTGTFLLPTTNPNPSIGMRPYSLALGDIDGDGDLDLITGNGDYTLGVRLNQPAVPNITSFTPTSGSVGTSVTITGINLNGVSGVSFNGTAQTNITGNTATSLTVNVPNGATTGTLQITTQAGTATSNQIFTIAAPGPLTWSGVVSTAWNVPGNWSANLVPVATDDVVIPSGTPFPPTVSALQAMHDLTINAGAVVTIANLNAAMASLEGHLINDGQLNNSGPAGTLFFGGNAVQTVSGTSTTTVSTLSVGPGATGVVLRSPVRVSRLLEVAQSLASNGNLTLLSTAQGTAYVRNVGPGAVTGLVTVQRHLDPSQNAGLGYRHFSAPVAGATVGDLATGTFNPVVNPAYNTQGNTVTPFPSVYAFDEARIVGTSATTQRFDRGFLSPDALTSTLVPGRGYTVNLDAASRVALVGTLHTGSIAVGALSRGSQAESGWHLLGNPYPAPLDWKKVRQGLPTGVADAVYVFKSSSQYTGTYQFYQNGFGTLPDGLIASMQGFFVRVSQPVAAFTFVDAWRATEDASPVFQRGAADARPAVQIELVSATGVRDAAFVYFEQGATAGLDDDYDAAKLPNTTGLNLASVVAGQPVAVNGLPQPSTRALTVPLVLGVPTTGTYTLHAARVANFAPGTQPYLRDLHLNTLTDLSRVLNYTFTRNATDTAPRFELVFGPQQVLGSASAALSNQVGVYPNPANAAFTVQVPAVAGASSLHVELLNALGQVVRSRRALLPATGAHLLVETGGLPAGVYTLRLQAGAASLAKRVVLY